jgi:ferredoxin
MLVIDPRACVDCGLCVTACPVEAIVPENCLSAEQREFLMLNATMSDGRWPNIVKSKTPMPGADDWAKIRDKRQELTQSPQERGHGSQEHGHSAPEVQAVGQEGT